MSPMRLGAVVRRTLRMSPNWLVWQMYVWLTAPISVEDHSAATSWNVSIRKLGAVSHAVDKTVLNGAL